MMKKGILFILVVVVIISTAVMSYASNNVSNITLQIGNTTATVYGKQAVLDAAPVIIDGRTMVPIRFVAESLNCAVDWDAENKAVTILQYKNFGLQKEFQAEFQKDFSELSEGFSAASFRQTYISNWEKG